MKIIPRKKPNYIFVKYLRRKKRIIGIQAMYKSVGRLIHEVETIILEIL